MKQIYPCLWLDNEAEEAARFYTSIFAKGQINDTQYYLDSLYKPEGSILTVDFTIANQRFLTLNGGPEFTITPAISFFVDCETKEELEQLWGALLTGGMELMPLQEYAFSEYFGWVQDQYGVSWQLSLTKMSQRISPAVMFANEKFGRAKEAMDDWISLFPNSEIVMEVIGEDYLEQGVFTLNGQVFRVMDSPIAHPFGLTMGVSFCVDCPNQAEIDRLWAALTHDGKEFPCGWAEDSYGVFWQIQAENWETFVDTSNLARAKAVMNELYQMKKIEIARLQAVYDSFE